MSDTHPLTQEWIIKQKKMAANLATVKEITEWRVMKYKDLSRLISVALSDGKCQSCGTKNRLTFHHMIIRQNKKFIPIINYTIQRHYFANVWVLCTTCHDALHDHRMLVHNDVGGNITSMYNDILTKQKEFEEKHSNE